MFIKTHYRIDIDNLTHTEYPSHSDLIIRLHEINDGNNDMDIPDIALKKATMTRYGTMISDKSDKYEKSDKTK